ncbi:MAG TPA: hypothetical protein VE033_06050 [Acetobacteraceae bacterium]|jgi:hypothetical protein|nr:hypothetical protein [Acetobacteraceae bacterium]
MRLILAAAAALVLAGPAGAQIGGSGGVGTSPGLGGPTSGMAAEQGGTDAQATARSGAGGRTERDAARPDLPRIDPPSAGGALGSGGGLAPAPADRSPAGGSALGGSGVPGTATGGGSLGR